MPQNKKKKNTASNGSKKVTVVVKQPQPQPGPSGVKPKRKGPGPSSSQGMMSLRRSELVTAVTVPKSQAVFTGVYGFDMYTLPYLKRFKDLFERWVVHSVKYTFKTACPSTQGGRVQMGFDWSGTASTGMERAQVAMYVPSVGGVIWRDFQMTLPARELMSRRFYQTSSATADKVDSRPGVLVVRADALMSAASSVDFIVGEIWVEYSVKLMDPRPA